MEKPRKGLNEGRVLIFENSLKVAIAKDYIDGKSSYRQLGLKYDLPAETVRYFVRWYQKIFSVVSAVDPVIPALDSHDALAKELAITKLKLTAMEMMIKNYEKETGVDIIKKSGSKRPVK